MSELLWRKARFTRTQHEPLDIWNTRRAFGLSQLMAAAHSPGDESSRIYRRAQHVCARALRAITAVVGGLRADLNKRCVVGERGQRREARHAVAASSVGAREPLPRRVRRVGQKMAA